MKSLQPALLLRLLVLSLCSLLATWTGIAGAAFGDEARQLEPLQILEIADKVDEGRDVSAVAMVDGLLVLAVDEGRDLQWFQLEDGKYHHVGSLALTDDQDGDVQNDAEDDVEVDVEGLAVDGGFLYAVGSHSATRKRVKKSKSLSSNRKRLTRADDTADPHRDALLRIRLPLLDDEAQEADIAREDGERDDAKIEHMAPALRPTLDENPYLELFSRIPSKENGIDIEGLAVREGQVFLGFRGPVLRGGFAPVMTFPFGAPAEHEMLFVQLGGRGIRSLSHTKSGFLMIGGPVGDSDQSYRLYEWDGRDCIPGRNGDDKRRPPCQLIDLGTLPSGPDSKAEGLAILEETANHYRLLVVFDGAKKGAPSIFHVPR